jgi:hypothetical protein
MTDSDTDALAAIIKALKPVPPEERRRHVEAAMTFLGEGGVAPAAGKQKAMNTSKTTFDESRSAAASKWMADNSITDEELDRVFHIKGDGSFDIHDVPGKSKKERTLNTYILTGVGKFLTTDGRGFDDSTARGFCEKIGCYDPANHAVQLKKNKGGEFSGDKKQGYNLTNIGLKRGAILVRELAGAGK